jgi:hypothetical protein
VQITKKVYLLSAISLYSVSIYSQIPQKEADLHPSPFFGRSYTLQPYSRIYLNDTTFRRNTLPVKFDFYGLEADKLYLKLHYIQPKKTLPITDNIALARTQNASVSGLSADDNPLFYLKLGSIQERFAYTYEGVEFGYLGLPLKIRPKIDTFATSFATDVGVGTYIGYQFGRVEYAQKQFNRYSLTVGVFAAPSVVSLNGGNLRTSATNTAFTALGLSAGGGCIFSINAYEFGLVSGVDWLDGANAKNWVFNGQPWFGVSIGTIIRKARAG